MKILMNYCRNLGLPLCNPEIKLISRSDKYDRDILRTCNEICRKCNDRLFLALDEFCICGEAEMERLPFEEAHKDDLISIYYFRCRICGTASFSYYDISQFSKTSRDDR